METKTNTATVPATPVSVRPHRYDWIELRCVFCDIRPHSRYAKEPCEG